MEDYNWGLILAVSVPIALAEVYIFNTGLNRSLKWFLLAIGLALTGAIIYFKDKKKTNIFTGIGIVFLAALIVMFLKEFQGL